VTFISDDVFGHLQVLTDGPPSLTSPAASRRLSALEPISLPPYLSRYPKFLVQADEYRQFRTFTLSTFLPISIARGSPSESFMQKAQVRSASSR
jgi:hypothetical protein